MAEDISHELVIAALIQEYSCGEIIDYELPYPEDLSMDESNEFEVNPEYGIPEILLITHDEPADTVDRVFEVFSGLELLAIQASVDKQCTVYPIFII